MITCKEDLVNTYIENDNGVLRDVYVSLLLLNGIEHQSGYHNGNSWYDLNYIGFCSKWSLNEIGQSVSDERGISECKQLTLADLLPTSYENTKVYSLDEDVIRKYAELCGVEYNHRHTDDEEVGICKVNNQGFVDTFIVGSVVDIRVKCTALTTEQILAAWDLRFNQDGESKMIDLELAKKIGATHYSSSGRLYKKGFCNFSEFNGHSWETLHDSVAWRIEVEKINFVKPPRTKIEYVKCEFEHAWQAVKAFEEGVKMHFDAAYDMSSEPPAMVEVASEMEAARYAKCDALYERTEFEIDWYYAREEFLEGCEDSDYAQSMDVNGKSIHDNDFIEMCHLVAELTDKPQ